jgi:hypothetical protein
LKPFVQIEPVTAAACSAEWIETRREVIERHGFLTRAGAGNTIEIRTQTPPEQMAAHDPLKFNPWVRLILPDGAVAFVSAADRDSVLQALNQPQKAP